MKKVENPAIVRSFDCFLFISAFFAALEEVYKEVLLDRIAEVVVQIGMPLGAVQVLFLTFNRFYYTVTCTCCDLEAGRDLIDLPCVVAVYIRSLALEHVVDKGVLDDVDGVVRRVTVVFCRVVHLLQCTAEEYVERLMTAAESEYRLAARDEIVHELGIERVFVDRDRLVDRRHSVILRVDVGRAARDYESVAAGTDLLDIAVGKYAYKTDAVGRRHIEITLCDIVAMIPNRVASQIHVTYYCCYVHNNLHSAAKASAQIEMKADL